jgi:hypothetical protein
MQIYNSSGYRNHWALHGGMGYSLICPLVFQIQQENKDILWHNLKALSHFKKESVNITCYVVYIQIFSTVPTMHYITFSFLYPGSIQGLSTSLDCCSSYVSLNKSKSAHFCISSFFMTLIYVQNPGQLFCRINQILDIPVTVFTIS